MDKPIKFNYSDVIQIAKAIVNNWENFERDNCGPWQSERDFIKCQFCHENIQIFENKSEKKFIHSLDCPVLIAQDMLTGIE